MKNDTPFLFFRVRENGAAVFRVTPNGQNGRMEMDHVATANIRNGDIRPHGDATLTPEETPEIMAWITARQATLKDRQAEELGTLCDDMNRVAHWIQSKAEHGDIEPHIDRLLISMHDLRQVLVRKIAD